MNKLWGIFSGVVLASCNNAENQTTATICKRIKNIKGLAKGRAGI